MKKFALGLGAALLALTSACGGGSDAAGGGSDAPYRVLFIGPLSGPAAAIADAQVAGLKASVKTVNASGGINGRTVELVTKDDQLDPTKAISLLQSELSSNRPDMVIPGVTSDEGLSILPVLTQNKIFAMGGLVSDEVNQPDKYPYFFSNGQALQPSANAEVAALKAQGFTSSSYVRADTANGKTALNVFKKAAEAAGISVEDFTYSPTAVDLTDVLQRATASNPDALVFDGYGASVGYVLQARQKLKLATPTYGDLSTCLSNPASLVSGAALDGFQMVCPKVLQASAEESPALADFKTAIASFVPEFKLTLNQYSGPYDSLIVLQAAAEQAGSTDTEALTKAMLNLPDSLNEKVVTYSKWAYTQDDRQVQVPESDYEVIPATALKDGQFTPSS